MAGLFRVRRLQDRKRALVAESEAYRQSLTLQCHNFRLYSLQVRRKVSRFASPLLLLLPLAGPLLSFSRGRFAARKRPFRWIRLPFAALSGWQMYRRFAPLLRHFSAPQRAASPRSAEEHVPAATEEHAPAANI
jgi:hypothetical protein